MGLQDKSRCKREFLLLFIITGFLKQKILLHTEVILKHIVNFPFILYFKCQNRST